MKQVEQMNFAELWDYMNNKDAEEFKKTRKHIALILGIGDAALRYRKRNMLFKPVEQNFLTALLRVELNNKKIEKSILFPKNK